MHNPSPDDLCETASIRIKYNKRLSSEDEDLSNFEMAIKYVSGFWKKNADVLMAIRIVSDSSLTEMQTDGATVSDNANIDSYLIDDEYHCVTNFILNSCFQGACIPFS